MQQAVVLFGAQRWGKEYVADMVRQAGATIVWPSEWEQAKRYAAQTVIALDDFVAEEAQTVAQALGVPFYNAEAHHTTFNKHRLRQLWNQLADGQPQLQPVPYSLLPAGQVLQSVPPFPVIIKPDAYSGSVGVAMVPNADGLNGKLAWLQGVLKLEHERFRGDFDVCQDILIESAIARKELDASEAEFTLHMLSLNGSHRLLASSQKQIDPHTYIEVGHTVPAVSIPAHYLEQAAAATARLLQSLGVQKCISNWEFIVTPDNQIALIEGQLRPSGDRLMQLIYMARGINPFEALLFGKVHPTKNSTAQIRWLGPKDVKLVEGGVTVLNMPNGWQTIADIEALRNNPEWPGPIDWYNRYVAVMGVIA